MAIFKTKTHIRMNKPPICIAATFIQKYKVTCTEPRYKAVSGFSLLYYIENAPVHWHEESFSSCGILLSEENTRLYQC